MVNLGSPGVGDALGSSYEIRGVFLGMTLEELKIIFPPNGQEDQFVDEYNDVVLGTQYTWFERSEDGFEENVNAYFVPGRGLTSFVLWQSGFPKSLLGETYQRLCAKYGHQSECDGDPSDYGYSLTWQDPSVPEVSLAASSEESANSYDDDNSAGLRLSLSNEPAMAQNRERALASDEGSLLEQPALPTF